MLEILPCGGKPAPDQTFFDGLADSHVLLGWGVVIAALIQMLLCFLNIMTSGIDGQSSNNSFGPFASVVGLGFLLLGILTIRSAWLIRRRRSRTFSIVIASLDCLFLPIGTIFGIYAIRVFCRAEVIEAYNHPPAIPVLSDIASQWEARREEIRMKEKRPEKNEN